MNFPRSVARMKRSGIRGGTSKQVPDYVSLHPGYDLRQGSRWQCAHTLPPVFSNQGPISKRWVESVPGYYHFFTGGGAKVLLASPGGGKPAFTLEQ